MELLNPRRKSLYVMIALTLFIVNCTSNTESPEDAQEVPSAILLVQETASSAGSALPALTVVIENQGGNLEGHTPRGFQGMGTGLFVGDNLNPRFPNGDGVQIFLTFDLSDVPGGEVTSAVLRSNYAQLRGTPFRDLGSLNVEQVRYDRFSSTLWNLEPVTGGANCVFATGDGGPFECDIADGVRSAMDDGYPFAQFRLRMDMAGDGDGLPDMVMFFKTDSNANEPGIFELVISVNPS